ncbi:hypothetical protein HDZ31DRAFT_32574 [Schizophyllum fasciatum]
MSPPPSYAVAQTSSSPSAHSKSPVDPLAMIWAEAVAKYEATTQIKAPSTPTHLTNKADASQDRSRLTPIAELDSAEGIFDYVRQHEAKFKAFREGGLGHLLGRLRPIAAVVGTLSGVVGEGVGVPFAPGKAVFVAVGELVKAALAVQDDFDAVCTAFDTMEQHLRVIQPVVSGQVHAAVREASVKLLAQILTVLGVITKVQKNGRIRLWVKKLAQSKEVSSALQDLSRLATGHHQAVSAVTLATVEKTLSVLSESQDRDVNRQCLAHIAQITQELYEEVQRTGNASAEENVENRRILESVQSALLRQVTIAEGDRKTADMDKLFNWLQYPDSSSKLNELLHNRAPSTGQWFLDGDDFAALKSGSKSFVWLQGKGDSGAIHDLRAFCSWPNSQAMVLMHFFDATNSAQPRNLRAMLSSLLCQLAYHQDGALAPLLRLLKDSMSGHSQPSLDAMRHQLYTLLDASSARVFAVIDALDEADDVDGEIIELLEQLRGHNIAVLISSRGEVPERERLESLCDAHVLMLEDLVSTDIQFVLRTALANGGALAKVKDTNLVRDALGSGADGNFRWTVLQIRELARIAGIPAKVRQRLKTLPKTLTEIYGLCLDSVDAEDRADVRRLLIWLLFTCVPLTTADFAQLLSFDYSDDMPVFDAELQPSSIDTVLSLVGSTFLAVHDGQVRLAHASVKDYLLALPSESDFRVDNHVAYSLMARTSLAYIGACEVPEEGQETRKPHHLTEKDVPQRERRGQTAEHSICT